VISEGKKALRKELLEKRNTLSEEEKENKSNEIAKRILEIPQVKQAKMIALYLTKGSEVNTRKLIKTLIKKNVEILVPVTKGEEEIKFCKFTSFEELTTGRFGILEPKTMIEPSREPEVVIVPGVGFDLDLHRLGYGKGYYDRYFKKVKTFKIGIGYELQLVEKIPRHEHDQRLDLTVTEKRVISL